MTHYPIFGGKSKIHIIAGGNKTCLCGKTPGIYWEMVYGNQVYPEISETSIDKYATTLAFREGLRVADEHVAKIHFCKKCYEKMIEIINGC